MLLAMSSRVFGHEFTCFWEMSSRVFRFTNLCIHVFVMGSRVFRHVFTNFWSLVDVFLVMSIFCHEYTCFGNEFTCFGHKCKCFLQ